MLLLSSVFVFNLEQQYLYVQEAPMKGHLLMDLEDALRTQRPHCMTALSLRELKESRLQSHIEHRLKELEGFFLFFVNSYSLISL